MSAHRWMALAIAAAAIAPQVAGCRGPQPPGEQGVERRSSDGNSDGRSEGAPRAGAEEKAMTPQDTLAWKGLSLPELGLDADVVDGIEVRSGGSGADHHITQFAGPVWLAIARGPAASLAALVQSLTGVQESSASAPEAATLCGRVAQRLIVTRQPPAGEGAQVQPDGSLALRGATSGPRTYVAVAFEEAGVWTRAVWIVDSAARERYRDAEAHFFASIRCR